MSFNLKKKEVFLKETIFSKYVTSKVESDLIVPDVMPDISKILEACGRAAVTQKNIRAGKAYIDGIVYLTVIYVPEGGGIKSIFSNVPFCIAVDAPAADEKSRIIAEAEIESIDCQIANSRKINLKINLGIDVKICRCQSAYIPLEIEQGEEVQTQYEELRLVSSSLDTERDFHFRDTAEVSATKPDICEIIRLSARICPTELRLSDEKLSLSGEVMVSVLYSDFDGGLCSFEENLPLTETLDNIVLPSGTPEAACLIKDINFEVLEDQNGARRLLKLDLLVCGSFKASESITLNAISDAFGTREKTRLKKATYEAEKTTAKTETQISHRDEARVPDYLGEIYKICDCRGEARVTGISLEDGKINITGEILSNIIYLADSEERTLSGFCHVSTFSHSFDAQDEGKVFEIKAALDRVSYSITSERSLELRFTVLLSLTVSESEAFEVIDAIEIDDEKETRELPLAIIYFPDEGETVWDVAKRYMTTPEALIEANVLDGEELHKGQKICIFR